MPDPQDRSDGLVASARRSPLVSIITPTFNREALLAQTIESVIAQDFTDWEMIVVDDGSVTPATRDLVEAYCARDSRISYQYREHRGTSAARNHAISLARGEYLGLLDSDDRYLPDGLSILVKEMQAAPPGVKLVYGDFLKHLEAEGRYVPTRTRPPAPRPGLFFQFLVPGMCPIAPCACLVARSAVDDIGGFDSAFDGVEDREIWSRLVQRHDIHHFSAMVAIYRKHDRQVTRNHPLRRLVNDRQVHHFFSALPLETWFPHAGTDADIARSLSGLARELLKCQDPPLDSALHMLRLAQGRQFTADRERFIQQLDAQVPRILSQHYGTGERIVIE